jgi:hypothetical protein
MHIDKDAYRAENGVVHYHYPYPVYIQATEWVDMEIGKGKIKSM